MAKRMKSKIQPSVLTLTCLTDAAQGTIEPVTDPLFPTTLFYYADLSKMTSEVNRRFYRQGLNWAVSHIEILTSGEGNIQVNKLPQTWVMSNAWEKGFRAWQRQQREALQNGDQESVKAKFNDFKIYMNARHHGGKGDGELKPTDSEGNYVKDGEWEHSQVVIPNYGSPGNNYEPYFVAVGDNVPGTGGAISLVKAYENSRSTPQSPDPNTIPGITNTENIYSALFDVGDNNLDVMANVVGKNNDLPYDQDEYPGGDSNFSGLEIHSIHPVTTTTIGGSTTIPGSNFPCGLIEFGIISDAPPIIKIHLVPGSHRGYLAEPMTEM